MMGFGFFGGLFMLLFWGGLIALLVWGVSAFLKNDSRNFSGQQHSQSPKEILDMRYAKGEITQDQYEQAKQDIGV